MLAARAPASPLRKKRHAAIFCFSHLCLQVNLRQRYKNKRYRFLDTFLLRSLAEREGFEPPEPRSSTVFKTAAIDHSATSPKDKSIGFFLFHQIFLQLFFNKFYILFIQHYISTNYNNRLVKTFFVQKTIFARHRREIHDFGSYKRLSESIVFHAIFTTHSKKSGCFS